MKILDLILKNLLKGELIAITIAINVLIETIMLNQSWINYRSALILIFLLAMSMIYGCLIVSIKVFPLIDKFLK